MNAIFLIAVLLVHNEGDVYTKRQTVVAVPSVPACEAVASELRQLWRKEFAHATISVECVKVVRLSNA